MSEDVRNELSTPSRVRARFARFGAARPAGNPVLELAFLEGRKRLADRPVSAILTL